MLKTTFAKSAVAENTKIWKCLVPKPWSIKGFRKWAKLNITSHRYGTLFRFYFASGTVQEKKGLPQPLRSRDSTGLSAKLERRASWTAFFRNCRSPPLPRAVRAAQNAYAALQNLIENNGNGTHTRPVTVILAVPSVEAIGKRVLLRRTTHQTRLTHPFHSCARGTCI